MFAKVVVDIKSSQLAETFDYQIPKELQDYVFIGSRVIVPFAFRDVLGYVVEINDKSAYQDNIKAIKDVFSLETELSEEQVLLGKDLSQSLNIPLVSALSLMMPSFLKEKKRKTIHVENYANLDPSLALEFKGKVKINLTNALIEKMPLIQKEITKGNLSLGYDFFTYGKNKKQKTYYIVTKTPQKSQIRENIINYLTQNPNALEEDIIRATSSSVRLLRKMAQERLIAYNEVLILDEVKQSEKLIIKRSITFDQEQLIEKYREINDKAFLLFSSDHNFLASFYLTIIDDNIKNNKSTLFLVPNILYAEEISAFIREHTKGVIIYAYHSKNSYSDNYDAYMSIKSASCDVIVATAMGIFLPFTNLGTIFISDEESSDYINEFYPYYNSIEVAQLRVKRLGAKLVKASSSPSIETFYQVVNNELVLLDDHKKYSSSLSTTIVNMKEERLEESSDILSRKLISEISIALKEEKISLLIVNQKAFATMIRCRSCNKILKCPKCNIPLVLSQKKNEASCAYCDYKTENYHSCECGSQQMISTGFGMEQVEEKVKMLFPQAKVLSFALSEQKTNEDYNRYLASLEEKEVDIIIGTNALTKTFHYDNIKVVGLLYADSFLQINDYRGASYTYNLVSSLSSRPVMVIQTYYPDNFALNYAKTNDYHGFYQEEIKNRALLDYPPFKEMNRLIITSPKDAFHFANYYRKALRNINDVVILGPSYDYRARGVKLIIKHHNYDIIIKILNDAIRHFNKQDLYVSFERYPKGM